MKKTKMVLGACVLALSAIMTLQAEPKEVQQDEALRQIVDGAKSQGSDVVAPTYATNRQNAPSVATGQKTGSSTQATPQPNQSQKSSTTLKEKFVLTGVGVTLAGLVTGFAGWLASSGILFAIGMSVFALGWLTAALAVTLPNDKDEPRKNSWGTVIKDLALAAGVVSLIVLL